MLRSASTGHPLDPATRAFMEPRFGRDLSQVRIHTGAAAADSAQALSAAAYTVGPDIVFGAGHYAPASTSGRKLLAHELAHVVQPGGPAIRRMTLGKGDVVAGLEEVPDEERERVLAAVDRVRKVAKDLKGYATCHATYAEACPNKKTNSLEKAFDTAVLWRIPNRRRVDAGATTACQLEEEGELNNRNVGYTRRGYDGGVPSLAFDLLHELGHVCGISCEEKPHYLADKLALYCMGPLERDQNQQLTFRFGRSTEDYAALLSFGGLLYERRAGRVGLRLNADLNVVGGLRALAALAGEKAPAGEIAGVGLDLRLRPFSGEHFGGLSFHAGLGSEIGRFRIRPPAAGDPEEIRFGAAAVLEAGTRIEWWVKNEDAVTDSGPGRVKPRAIDFSYRLLQPFSPGARRVHEVLASYIYHL